MNVLKNFGLGTALTWECTMVLSQTPVSKWMFSRALDLVLSWLENARWFWIRLQSLNECSHELWTWYCVDLRMNDGLSRTPASKWLFSPALDLALCWIENARWLESDSSVQMNMICLLWLKLISKRRKLAWFGHVTRHDSLSKTILQGILEGGRRRGRQRKCWMDNIKEWTSLPLPKMLTQGSMLNRPSCPPGWTELTSKLFILKAFFFKSINLSLCLVVDKQGASPLG